MEKLKTNQKLTISTKCLITPSLYISATYIISYLYDSGGRRD